jgi:hypothetical protein
MATEPRIIGETARPQPVSSEHGAAGAVPSGDAPATAATEVGGRDGPDPTRYGDWEKNGRCIDF